MQHVLFSIFRQVNKTCSLNPVSYISQNRSTPSRGITGIFLPNLLKSDVTTISWHYLVSARRPQSKNPDFVPKWPFWDFSFSLLPLLKLLNVNFKTNSEFPTAQRHDFFRSLIFWSVIGRVRQTWASKSEGLFSQTSPTPFIFPPFLSSLKPVHTTHTFLKCKTETPSWMNRVPVLPFPPPQQTTDDSELKRICLR